MSNFGYRVKNDVNETCFGGADIPGALAPMVCQTGITDGYFAGSFADACCTRGGGRGLTGR